MQTKRNLIDIAFILGFLMVVLQCFSYMYIVLPTRSILFLFLFYILFLLSTNAPRAEAILKYSAFGRPLLFLICGYFVTFIFSWMLWGEPFLGGFFQTLRYVTVIVFFFYLYYKNIPEKGIIKTLIWITIIWTILEFVQQVTYPRYWFCGRAEDKYGNLEERMGLIRFYITGVHAAILVLLYYAHKFSQESSNRLRNFLVWSVAMMGIIGFVSRKQIYASLLVSIISFLRIKGKMRYILLLALIPFAYYGINILWETMTDLNQQTLSEVGSDDFIRTLATNFFLFDFQDSPSYYLFGTGDPSSINTPMGKKYMFYQEYFGYYAVDCGIVGYMANFGIVNILLFLLPIFKMVGRWKELLLWHKLYLVYYGIMFNMAFWGNSMLGLTSYIVFLYLVDIHLNRARRLKATTNCNRQVK